MVRKACVVGAILLGVLLSGCGGTLSIGQTTPGPATTGKGLTAEATSPAPALSTVPASATVSAPDPPADAPDPAAAPPADNPAASPTADPAFAGVALPNPADLEARWRDMQVDRVTFDPRPYVSSGYEIVWWFDPVFGQFLPIGQLRGEFTAQATFRVKGQWITALEMPYNVGKQYDLVVPDVILKRMQDAGKGEWAEVFIYETNDVRPK